MHNLHIYIYLNIGLLTSIGVRKFSSLTPKCRKMYAITYKILRKYRRVDSKKKLFKSRLQAAEQFADTYIMDKISDKLTATASLFTNLQIRETNKKSHGRRFTLDEKVLSLSLYKRSPKCYRLLSQIFTLPCNEHLTQS